MNIKPFNLEEAKAGKPVCTRDGKPARIICFDRKAKTYPIIALIDKGPFEVVYTYNNKGEYTNSSIGDFDLMMVLSKRKGWVNLYKNSMINSTEDRVAGKIFATRNDALECISDEGRYVNTIEIEWEE